MAFGNLQECPKCVKTHNLDNFLGEHLYIRFGELAVPESCVDRVDPGCKTFCSGCNTHTSLQASFRQGVTHNANMDSFVRKKKFDKKRQQSSLEKLYQKLGFLLVACHGLLRNAPGWIWCRVDTFRTKVGWKCKTCCVSLEPVEHFPPSKNHG